jgi:hypothetical protein
MAKSNLLLRAVVNKLHIIIVPLWKYLKLLDPLSSMVHCEQQNAALPRIEAGLP